MPGTLYVVATPIGNLEDITLRALRVLKEADAICAEDTRVTRKLLARFDIHTPLASYHEHSSEHREESLIARLESGDSLALVTDAGTPGISDPGGRIVARAIERGIAVVPVPGPSAAVAAVAVSGLLTGRYAFDGFAPRGRSDRREFFAGLAREPRTFVLYESPARVLSTLKDLLEALGERRIAVAREITKLHEEVFRGTLTEAIAHFGRERPRGEFTLVVAGRPEAAAPAAITGKGVAEPCLQDLLRDALASGATARDAAREAALRCGIPRRAAYQAVLAMRDHPHHD
ncbi:MAG: 16S rRNA (cytidine(1402)-2'-O)-methyltransferase [Chthonomonadales bacterium]|nr:16S rRNA (cytidine(1402)-2'-O)-methyltransferase [Chthonomonadales bacterium]